MTDPRERLSLAEHAAAPQRDLPQPPPLRLQPQTTLFLDFDGTLVDIAEHPDAVIVSPALPGILQSLSDRLEGRLALISGRSLAALEAMLGPMEIAMAGSHGGEFRPSRTGAVEALADPLAPRVTETLAGFARANADMLVEPKPFSVAVHYRHHPHARDALLALAQEIADAEGLRLKHGKQVVELVMPGSDKGSAVASFMARTPFAGTAPLFVGDDVTDEDAFAAVGDFAGTGVLVGPLRRTAAHWRLPDVSAVHRWLEGGLDEHANERGDRP